MRLSPDAIRDAAAINAAFDEAWRLLLKLDCYNDSYPTSKKMGDIMDRLDDLRRQAIGIVLDVTALPIQETPR